MILKSLFEVVKLPYESVCPFVGWTVSDNLLIHFHAPIGALVYLQPFMGQSLFFSFFPSNCPSHIHYSPYHLFDLVMKKTLPLQIIFALFFFTKIFFYAYDICTAILFMYLCKITLYPLILSLSGILLYQFVWAKTATKMLKIL